MYSTVISPNITFFSFRNTFSKNIKNMYIYCTGSTDQTQKVLFSAYLNQGDTCCDFNKGDVVKFNEVEVNETNAYNETTGVFTCPHPGIYQVTWFFINNNTTPTSRHVWLQLDINEAWYAFAGLHEDEQHNSAFRSHLLRLEQGDRLRIVAFNDNMKVLGAGSRHTGFSALYVSA